MQFIHGLFSKGCYHLEKSTSDGHFQRDHRNNGNISIRIPIFKRRLEIAASQVPWVSLTHISNGLLIRVYKHKTTPFLPAQIFNLTNSLSFFFSPFILLSNKLYSQLRQPSEPTPAHQLGQAVGGHKDKARDRAAFSSHPFSSEKSVPQTSCTIARPTWQVYDIK